MERLKGLYTQWPATGHQLSPPSHLTQSSQWAFQHRKGKNRPESKHHCGPLPRQCREEQRPRCGLRLHQITEFTVNTKRWNQNFGAKHLHYQIIFLKKKKMPEGNTSFNFLFLHTDITSPKIQVFWMFSLHFGSRFNLQTVLLAQFKNQSVEQKNELRRMVDFILRISTRHHNF